MFLKAVREVEGNGIFRQGWLYPEKTLAFKHLRLQGWVEGREWVGEEWRIGRSCFVASGQRSFVFAHSLRSKHSDLAGEITFVSPS